MVAPEFMVEPFKIKEMLRQYMQSIKDLKPYATTPMSLQKLKRYFNATKLVFDASVMDMAKFALTFGRPVTGKVAQIRAALPTLLANNVQQPEAIDMEYTRILIAYATTFKENKHNIKDFMLHFVLNSRLSPITHYVDRALERVIDDAMRNLEHYQTIVV